MPNYRLYFLEVGHICNFDVLDCDSDELAIELMSSTSMAGLWSYGTDVA